MRGLTNAAGSGIAALTILVAAASAQAQSGAKEVAHLLASDGQASDLFGFSVAMDGESAIIGAMGYDTVPGPIGRQGAAYIFVRDGGWIEQAVLVASDGVAGDNFGISVAIDGDTAVVGAYAPVGFRPGSAYVFTRTNGVWTEQARLTASDGMLFDYFGGDVAIQGETIVVGAAKADVAGRTDAGAAYVFQRGGGNHWNQRAKLTASDADHEDHFGGSVAIDGDTIVVGAPDDNSPAGMQPGVRDAGSAYVFVRNGGQWIEQAILAAPQPRFIGAFGYAVALRGDTLFVGEPDFSFAAPGPGAAYVFGRSAGLWSLEMRLDPADGGPLDNFGTSIAHDGAFAVIGAPRHDGDSGAAYTFKFRPADGLWIERAKLTASDGAPDDTFGIAVGLDAGTVLVGAVFDDTFAGSNAGSAYVFDLTGPRITPTAAPGAIPAREAQPIP